MSYYIHAEAVFLLASLYLELVELDDLRDDDIARRHKPLRFLPLSVVIVRCRRLQDLLI